MVNNSTQSIRIQHLGADSYENVWELQKELVQQRIDQVIPNTLILVEHPHVYTIGRNGDQDHILPSNSGKVPVYQIERGGDVTYHGPGQIVGYPILDLHDYRLSVSWYINSLEEVIIETLREFGITADRKTGFTGVWVGEKKIAAIGVRISRWVTMHGFALNVNTDLSYYDGIIPCGIFHMGVTSIKEIIGSTIPLDEVKNSVARQFILLYSKYRTDKGELVDATV